MSRIRTHRIGHFLGLPGASSLRTWLRPRDRAYRQPDQRKSQADAASHSSRASIERLVAPVAGADSRRRYWHWFDVAITILWVTLLLFIVSYAVVEGEIALMQLDGLSLVATYSMSP